MASGMKRAPILSYLWVLQLFIILVQQHSAIQAVDDHHQRKVHIVYMGEPLKGDLPAKALHLSMLKDAIGSSFNAEVSKHHLYSYEKGFNGFVANLTNHEAQKLSKMEGVVSLFLNKKRELATTRSWDFMGFPVDAKRNTSVESDIIIGVMDTGIWPDSASFSDDGFGPPPAKWKGTCSNITCNNKIIGARYFNSLDLYEEDETPSPLDIHGHGTHTASIAAGGIVNEATFFGYASGTARGGVPSARIAVYKVCWSGNGCHDADILAGFDAAIADGVDILSVSLGSTYAEPYLENSVAIGGYHAMRNGIFTSAAAGNSGPYLSTASNVAPWLLSVGASTIDRNFSNKIILGNGMVFEGNSSLNTFDVEDKTFPLIYGGAAQDLSSFESSRYCDSGSLNESMVKGKIILCDKLSKGIGAIQAGAAGAIMHENGTMDEGIRFPLPASAVSWDAGVNTYSYIFSDSNPVGTITKSKQGNDTMAPYVASFSSRGPNIISPDILKPDLTAPGVSILAAFSHVARPSGIKGDNRTAQFNIISGTSMACPHATAAAAYVKSFHSDWSPAAIKSALMTTAFPLKPNSRSDQAELAYGAGHINPTKAIDPGLVYDTDEIDYINFLCSQGFNTTMIRMLAGNESSCPNNMAAGTSYDLNYPSIAIPTNTSSTFTRSFNRTVTNVGSPNSSYVVSVTLGTALASNIAVLVEPNVLNFTSTGQKLPFIVTVSGTLLFNETVFSASMVWDDGVHLVRSPIVVYDAWYSSF